MLKSNLLNEESKKHAEKHLGETQQKREKYISEIKKFLIENPKINAKNDDYSILQFLRRCKFNLEETKIKLKNYYEMRAKVPEWFTNRDPNLSEIDELLKIGVFVPIVQKKPGPLIVIIRTGAHDPRKHKQNNVFKTGNMLLDLAIKEFETSTIYGVHAIFDMENVSYGHAKQLSPKMIKKAVYSWQNYHVRPQKLEFVNAPIYINVVLNIFRAFMTEKMKNRIHVHWAGKGFDVLHEAVDKDELPVEYGGNNGPLQNQITYWRNKARENLDWYKEDEKYKSLIEK